MFGRGKKDEHKNISQHVEQMNPPLTGGQLGQSLDANMKTLDDLFTDVDVMRSRRFQNQINKALDYCIYYSDGVVDSMMINEDIIKPLLLSRALVPGPGLFEAVRDQFVFMNEISATTEIQEIIESITYGDTLLLIEGCDQGLILGSKNFTLRGISEPEGEKVLGGPREGFNEGLMNNLSMIRRRLRTNQLKLKFRTLGRETATAICICYLDNIVNKKILAELERRLDTIDIDGVLDSNYITEHISEDSFMGFAATGYTERPDIAVSKMLEGRIAVVVDGTPMVLTLPYLFIENFQSNEDYYLNYYYTTFSRLLRMIGFLLTITIPAAYVAIVAYHHEILPADLMIYITSERQKVPLTAALECFIMLLVFDTLRETGVRMPTNVGQALSIVGALVIGQAAVEAKLVASPMIIVVAVTGITNLLVPKITSATLFCRYFFLILAANFGLTGLVVGLSLVLIHLLNLQSFGVPAVIPTNDLNFQEVKDTFIRAPWPKMLTRLAPLSGNTTRSKPGHVGGKGSAPK